MDRLFFIEEEKEGGPENFGFITIKFTWLPPNALY